MTEQETISSVLTESLFSDLRVHVGTPITIETMAPQKKYGVHLLGYWQGKSILISPPLNQGKEVLLEKDKALHVRMLVGKRVSAFETRVLYRSFQPYSYYHLAYPDHLVSMQVRNSERVSVDIKTFVTSDFNIFDDWPKKARIDNLSKSGVRLISSESLGDVGHELVVAFKLRVSDIEKTLSMRALIRNIEQDESEPANYTYVYGMQFSDAEDDDILTLTSYIYENNA